MVEGEDLGKLKATSEYYSVKLSHEKDGECLAYKEAQGRQLCFNNLLLVIYYRENESTFLSSFT